jgi:hypothetical protein
MQTGQLLWPCRQPVEVRFDKRRVQAHQPLNGLPRRHRTAIRLSGSPMAWYSGLW